MLLASRSLPPRADSCNRLLTRLVALHRIAVQRDANANANANANAEHSG
jgi:hypothetical protein